MPVYANEDYSRQRLSARQEEEETGILNEFGKGFGAGIDQLQALAGGAKALVGSAVGNDDWFYDGMQYFDEQMAEANENAADVGSVEDIGNLASVEGLGNLANYSAFIVGNIIPSLIGGGGVGAVGGAAAKSFAIHQGAKALIKKNAEGMAKGAASRQYAQSAVGREALGKAGLKGQMIGTTAFGTTMGAGESFTRIFDETGEEAAVAALATGLVSGVFDAWAPMQVLKRVLPQNLYGKATQEIAENISKKQSVVGRAFRQAAEVSGIEGVTEMSQEIVQNFTLELVRGQSDPRIEEAFIDRLFDEENRSQYLNAFVAGAIGGGAIGGVTGAVTKDPKLLDENELIEEQEDVSPEVAQDEEQAQDQNEIVEDQPQYENADRGGEKVQAARAKALGLPTARTTIAPKSPAQVRDEVDDFPERREASDPEAAQAEARAKARAQIDGLPVVRAKVKEIFQMELGNLGETTRIPKDQEPETVAEKPPEFGGYLPESTTPRMEELVGKDVDYNGNKGLVVKKDDGFYVATQDNGDVLIESGEYQAPEQLGVVPLDGGLDFEPNAQIDGGNKFELRGKKYTLTRIIRDADGKALSLAVRDEKGKKRTIRTPEVVARINSQKNPPPDFRQLIVDLDDLPASVQRLIVEKSDPENIPDSVPASEAIELAESLPNSLSMISGIRDVATQSLTISANATKAFPPVKYTESISRPSVKPLTQAIADVNKSQGSNRSPIDEGRINSLFDTDTLTLDDGTRLPSIMQNDGKEGTAQSDEIKSALVDLLGAGMPKRVLQYFKGLYVHLPTQGEREADGKYIVSQKAISLNKSRIRELADDADDNTSAGALMRFNLAHEIGHAFDLGTNHTLNSPDFSIDVNGMNVSGVTFDLGPVIYELGRNFQDGTELGQELGYPFGYAFEWLAETTPDNVGNKVAIIQKEAFAQAFAVFHASPEMLQEQAPLAYKHLKKLLRVQPTETIQDGEANIRSSETEQQSTEIQGQVRSSAESRSPEVQVQDGAGGDGRSGADAEQAGQGLGGQTQREDGDDTGRPLQLAENQDEQDGNQSAGEQDQQVNEDANQLSSPPTRNPQRMMQAKAQGFDTDQVLYHGTPQGSDFAAFDYKYTGQGDDQYGAGFYLTNSASQGSGYAGNRKVGESNTVIPAYTKNANLLKVDGKKASNLGDAIELDANQISRILEKAEPLKRGMDDEEMNPFGDRYESFWSDGPEQWMYDQLAQDQEGRNPDELAEFFDGDMQGYLTALSDVTGYDGIEVDFGNGLVNQVHWKPENIRSVNAQFDPAKTQSDDLLASPPRRPPEEDFVTAPTSTVAEIMSEEDLIASVRAGSDASQVIDAVKDKDVKAAAGFAASGFKKWFQKNFYSRGLLPETAFDSKIERDGEFGAVEMDIRQMVGLFDEAVQNNFGEIDASQAAVLDKAMQVPAAEVMASELPNDIKEALVAMRNYIDKMSADYAEILNSDIENLKSEGNDEALAKSELLSIVVNNMGKYANKSHRAFDDKNWNKEVPEDIILAARNFLVKQGTTNPDQVINTILKEGTAFDDMSSFIAESKLGAKDLSILKQRKDIAPEIRALLGEYKDARINFAKSATKMSRLIYNDRFLNQVLKDGKGVFLFDQADAPVGATKKIAEVGSKTMSPLNGLYTFPEVEQAFRDALDKEQLGGLYKTVIQINGLVKYGKTVIAPTTMARNWMSASLFTVANGHFNWSKIGKSIDVTSSYRTGQGDGVEYLKRLKKLGVVHDNPYAGEMIDLLKDTNVEQWVSGTGMIKSFFDNATRFYQYGDDFWKIVGFENEIINFMDNKGMSREDAEIQSAKRIRDTYPTYSLIGDLPQKLRRFPLAGTFVSFPAEIARTQYNMVKYLQKDLADPDMRPAALKRMAGMAMVSAGVYAAQAMAMSAFGVSEEEEEAIKLMAAPWAKNSNILVTGRDDEGRLEYLDLTHLDPYALMKRPLNALLRDQPIDDALIDASAEILKPFLGWDISTNTILEFVSNEKTSGGEVYNEADTFINKAEDTYMHFERGMGPSVIQNGRRMVKAMGGEISKSGRAYDVGDEMAAFVGFRKTTFDPKVALHFKAYEFSEGKRQSTKLLTSVFRNPNDVSDSDIREAFGRASTARKETFGDMTALVNAAMKSGLSATQAMQVLRSNGVTKKDAKALVGGGASAWTMSDSTLKNSIAKSDVLFGEQKSKQFRDRWTLIQQLLNEEN